MVVLISVLAPAQSEVVTEHSTQVSATAASGTSGNVLKTTICEVVANPDSFDGKMIDLRGDVSAGVVYTSDKMLPPLAGVTNA